MSEPTWSDWYSPSKFSEKYPDANISLSSFLDTNQNWVSNPRLETMFVFLDTPQMKIFSQSDHNYLITTIREHKFQQLTSTEQNLPLFLFEPI